MARASTGKKTDLSGSTVADNGAYMEVVSSRGRNKGLASLIHRTEAAEEAEAIRAAIKVLIANAFRGQADVADRFLSAPHPLLAGKSPAALMSGTVTEARQVLALVNRALAGVAI
jgi:uncharacterized protein (DUF2384 family)